MKLALLRRLALVGLPLLGLLVAVPQIPTVEIEVGGYGLVVDVSPVRDAEAGPYTHRSTGTIASNTNGAALNPGAPAGLTAGDLMILRTCSLLDGTAAEDTGWTNIYQENDATTPSIEVWARIADGGANDAATVDWSGADDSTAWISAYSGDEHTDLGTIVSASTPSSGGGQVSDLSLGTLDVTVDNTLVDHFACKVKTATSNDATTLTAPTGGGTTKRAQVLSADNGIFAISSDVAQTTATDHDGSNFTRDGTNETGNVSGVSLSLLSDSAAVPTWDTNANVQSQSAAAFTLQYDASADADNIYCAAFPSGTAEQTGAAIEAGTGAHGTATEATTGASDTIVLTPTDSPAFPAYEPQCVLENETGYSTVISLPNEFLDPPTGKQFQTLASVHADSPCFGQTPAVVAGDIAVFDTLTNINGYAIMPFDTCLLSIAAGGDDSFDTFDADVYDVSLAAYYGAATFPVNNQPLIFEGGSVLDDPLLLAIDAAITPIDLLPLVIDPEGHTVVVTALEALPTGLSITASGDYPLNGTPTACGNTLTDIQWEDEWGATLVVEIDINIGDIVPNVVGMTEAEALDAIAAFCNP